MKSFDITIGKGRNPETIDAAKLVEGRCLIQGTSGSGKSYLARVIAEQTIPQGLQTIILDSEGEFLSLREKCDVLIAGSDGDVPCEVRSSKLLARRVAETGVSAVIDMSDLKIADRREFVRIFLDTLDGLPKKLERPRIVMLDEAHKFCPESGKGKSTSTDAVITLMSQGRKRGLAGVLLTQRLSKVKKDAAAEAANVFIGKTSPIDLHSAQDMLGATKEHRERLRFLAPGQFYATGPGLSGPGDVGCIFVKKASTTHPQAGNRYKMEAPPPQRAIKKILAEFADLPPDQADEDEKTLSAAKARISELTRALRDAESRASQTWRQPDLSAYVSRRDYDRLKKAVHRRELALQKLVEQFNGRLANLFLEIPRLSFPDDPEQPAAPRQSARDVPRVTTGRTGSASSGFDRMLHALAQHKILTKEQLGVLAGISAKGKKQSGTFRNYVSKGKVEGYWSVDGKTLTITDAGVRAAGDFEPLPVGTALVEYWMGHKAIPNKAGHALDYICLADSIGATKEQVAEHIEIQSDSGTFRNYISRIRALGLISGKGTADDPFIGAEILRTS